MLVLFRFQVSQNLKHKREAMSLKAQLTSWFKNLAGRPLTEQDYHIIPYAEAEVTVHTTLKTVQAGSLLGGWLLGPLYALFKGGLVRSVGRFGAGGMAVGLAAGPIATLLRKRSLPIDQQGFYDRAYRLRHNAAQLNVDRATLFLGGLGMIAKGFTGAVFGVNTGLALAFAYNNYETCFKTCVKKEEGEKKED